jgi:VWFA-related protein
MSIPRTDRILPLLLLAAVLLLAYKPGKATAETPTFKSTTRIVLVDVVVTDGTGKPVHDLKARDFSVLDDGKPQGIVACEEQRSDATPKPPIPLNLPDHVYTNYVTRSDPGALTVLLFDSLNANPRDLTYARNRMLNFLKNLSPGKRVALYALGSQLRMVHSFTENSDELIAAAQELSIHPHLAYSNTKEFSAAINELKNSAISKTPAFRAMVRFLGEEYEGKLERRAQGTLDAFAQLAHALAIVPGRKNLIWISGGFPFDSSSNARELQKVATLLAANRIAVYPVDARGVVVTGADGQATGSDIFSQIQSYEPLSGQDEENGDIVETMQNIAKITGGRAHINDNDPEASIADSMQTGSNYYSLEYRPVGVEWNGQFRKIAVKTTRPNVKLLYRSGYYAIADPSNLKEDASRALARALEPSAPASTQFIMKARVIPPEKPGEATQVDIFIDVHDLAVTEDKGQKTPDVQFVAVAWDGGGKRCASFSEEFHTVSGAQYESLLRIGLLQVHQEMPLKPGSYQLRLGVMDRLSGRIGTLDVPLTIGRGVAAK